MTFGAIFVQVTFQELFIFEQRYVSKRIIISMLKVTTLFTLVDQIGSKLFLLSLQINNNIPMGPFLILSLSNQKQWGKCKKIKLHKIQLMS